MMAGEAASVITRRQFVKSLGLATVGTAGFGGYALAEPWGTGVTRYRVSPPNWPKGLSLKLALIADVHACDPFMSVERIRGIVEQTHSLEPDAVLLLGDYVASHSLGRYATPVKHADWARALGHLKAPLGVHAVLGNHDWWDDLAVQKRGSGCPRAGLALQDAGIILHDNTAMRLAKDGFGVWLAGLGDQQAFWRTRVQQLRDGVKYIGVDDLAGTLSQVHDDAPIVLMAHEPDIFASVPDRVALTVAGHTHGGQIRVLGYAPVVPSRFGNRYVYGHIVEGGRNLIVSGGLGCSGIPVRFGSPPEIVMVELSA
jgi:predicted MPP superfamily phosphohydrolase